MSTWFHGRCQVLTGKPLQAKVPIGVPGLAWQVVVWQDLAPEWQLPGKTWHRNEKKPRDGGEACKERVAPSGARRLAGAQALARWPITVTRWIVTSGWPEAAAMTTLSAFAYWAVARPFMPATMARLMRADRTAAAAWEVVLVMVGSWFGGGVRTRFVFRWM